jgi:hypothetical protein
MSAGSVPPLTHRTSCTVTKSNLYYIVCFATVVSEPYRESVLSHVHFPLLRSVQRIHPSLRPCVTYRLIFYGEELLAPSSRTTPHWLSVTVYALYSQLPFVCGGNFLHSQLEDTPFCGDKEPTWHGPDIVYRSACNLLHTGFFLGLSFDPDGGDMFLWNVSWLSTDYMSLYSRRQNSLYIFSFIYSVSWTTWHSNRFCVLKLLAYIELKYFKMNSSNPSENLVDTVYLLTNKKTVYIFTSCLFHSYKIANAIQTTADFLDSRFTDGSEVVSLMRQSLFTPRKIPGTHFHYRLSWPQGHSADGKISSIEKSSDLIGNRTCDLPACSLVRQSTTLLRAPSKTLAV